MSQQSLPNIFLCFWNLDVKDAPHVDDVRARLTDARLDAERATDVPPTTALSRAASAIKDKEHETKTYTSKESERPRVQIDTLTELDGRLKRTFNSAYELDADTETPRLIGGPGIPDFIPAFDDAKTHYTGADISKVIKSILENDGLGAYSPRKNGGVYFVPVAENARDLLTRLENFCTPLGVRFLTYTVPDTDAQRAEIADAICEAYSAQIEAHGMAIAEYTTDTRPGIIENRREALQETYAAMQRLQNLMNGRYPGLCATMRDQLAKLRSLETEQQTRAEQQERHAEEQAQQAQHEGRRQIVVS